jgi:FkbM family methyltransferase
MGIKRKLADLVGQLTGTVVVTKWETHQLPEREHLRRFFDHFGVDCVFDVGANEGQTAEKLRDMVGYRGHIVSFEPIPEMVDKLRRKAQRDPRWHIVEGALDREPGTARFNVMSDSLFSSLHAPTREQPGDLGGHNNVARVIEVKRTTLAEQLPYWREQLGFQRPFLKMDTQGNDVAVLEGAGDLVREFVGLQSELSMKPLYDGSVAFTDALSAFQRAGFELSAIVPNTAGHFPTLVEMDCIMFRPQATR